MPAGSIRGRDFVGVSAAHQAKVASSSRFLVNIHSVDADSKVLLNGLEFTYLEAGPEEGKPAILSHGLPFMRRHESSALDGASREPEPSIRGYGESKKSCPTILPGVSCRPPAVPCPRVL